VYRETGMMTNGRKIVCDVTVGGRKTSREKPLPRWRAIYLPRAKASLLGRLVDRRTPATYGFAAYSARHNDFDYYSFHVAGPATIEQGGQKLRAVKVIQQPAEDAEPSTVYLDGEGRIVRVQKGRGTADAFRMDAVEADAVFRRFEQARAVARSLQE
jgi:hypothetical protein